MTYRERIEGLREIVRHLQSMIPNRDNTSMEYNRYVSALVELNDFIGDFIKSGKELNDVWR